MPVPKKETRQRAPSKKREKTAQKQKVVTSSKNSKKDSKKKSKQAKQSKKRVVSAALRQKRRQKLKKLEAKAKLTGDTAELTQFKEELTTVIEKKELKGKKTLPCVLFLVNKNDLFMNALAKVFPGVCHLHLRDHYAFVKFKTQEEQKAAVAKGMGMVADQYVSLTQKPGEKDAFLRYKDKLNKIFLALLKSNWKNAIKVMDASTVGLKVRFASYKTANQAIARGVRIVRGIPVTPSALWQPEHELVLHPIKEKDDESKEDM